MSCIDTITDYGLRSIGIGERLLPRADFTLCQQFTLIGSGLIWNVYFRNRGADVRLCAGECAGLGTHCPQPDDPQTCGMVCVFVPRLALVHPVFLGL